MAEKTDIKTLTVNFESDMGVVKTMQKVVWKPKKVGKGGEDMCVVL